MHYHACLKNSPQDVICQQDAICPQDEQQNPQIT